MTAREMEVRLVALGKAWIERGDEAARDEYRRLHPLWIAAKEKAA